MSLNISLIFNNITLAAALIICLTFSAAVPYRNTSNHQIQDYAFGIILKDAIRSAAPESVPVSYLNIFKAGSQTTGSVIKHNFIGTGCHQDNTRSNIRSFNFALDLLLMHTLPLHLYFLVLKI